MPMKIKNIIAAEPERAAPIGAAGSEIAARQDDGRDQQHENDTGSATGSRAVAVSHPGSRERRGPRRRRSRTRPAVPRYAAASMVTGVFVSGSVPVHARRSSAKAERRPRRRGLGERRRIPATPRRRAGAQSVVRGPRRRRIDLRRDGCERGEPSFGVDRRCSVEPGNRQRRIVQIVDAERVLRDASATGLVRVPEQQRGRTSVRQLAPVSLAASVACSPHSRYARSCASRTTTDRRARPCSRALRRTSSARSSSTAAGLDSGTRASSDVRSASAATARSSTRRQREPARHPPPGDSIALSPPAAATISGRRRLAGGERRGQWIAAGQRRRHRECRRGTARGIAFEAAKNRALDRRVERLHELGRRVIDPDECSATRSAIVLASNARRPVKSS